MRKVKDFVYWVANGFVRFMHLEAGVHSHLAVLQVEDVRILKDGIRGGVRIELRMWGYQLGTVWLTHGQLYHDGANYAMFYSLFVHPMARRLGLGRRLVDVCVGIAKSKGFDELFLVCRHSNTAALSFYRDLGFMPLEEAKYRDYYRNELNVGLHRDEIGLYLDLSVMPKIDSLSCRRY